MSVAVAKWTIEEYHHLVAVGVLDDKLVELLLGEIVQMTPEEPLHSNRIRHCAKLMDSKSQKIMKSVKRIPLHSATRNQNLISRCFEQEIITLDILVQRIRY